MRQKWTKCDCVSPNDHLGAVAEIEPMTWPQFYDACLRPIFDADYETFNEACTDFKYSSEAK